MSLTPLAFFAYLLAFRHLFLVVGRAAQRFMIGRSLEWAGVQEGAAAPKTGVDIGEPISSVSPAPPPRLVLVSSDERQVPQPPFQPLQPLQPLQPVHLWKRADM